MLSLSASELSPINDHPGRFSLGLLNEWRLHKNVMFVCLQTQ